MIKLTKILEDCPVKSIQGEVNRPIRALQYDSRKVQEDDVFFAWKGEKTDGHQFIHEVEDRGAAAIVLENTEGISQGRSTLIEVANAREALATMSATFFDRPDKAMKMIGVTGTNGKTTTTFILKHLLTATSTPTGLIGTVRYEIGEKILPASRTTPESLDLYEILSRMRAAHCRAAVMEVSSHALAQGRVKPIEFQVGIFTNLSLDHLDFHKSMEKYFEAKSILFSNLDRTANPGSAVINLDDPHGVVLLVLMGSNVPRWTYSVEGHQEAGIEATDLRFSAAGTAGVLRIGENRAPFLLPLIGTFNVSNLLAAVGGALALGITEERIRDNISTIPQIPGRLEKFTSHDGVTAVVDYAHTDDAVRKVLNVLRQITPKESQLIVVIGCGGNRDKSKRPLMARAAVDVADLAIFTADNPRMEDVELILDDMVSGVSEINDVIKWQRISDRRQAIAQALALARPGDIVCLAGKGHESTQEIAGKYYPFDDRLVAQEFLQRRKA